MHSASAESHDQAPDLDDEFLWLEDINGDAPLDWVREENAATLARFRDDLFEQMSEDILTALDSDDRIPMVTKRGDHLYNFWRDTSHPKGLWRRTTWDSYVTDSPDWEILLDVDDLARSEDTPWVWAGAPCAAPTTPVR